MTDADRELLERAAKAAGIIGYWERDTDFRQERYYFNVPYDNQNMLTGFRWDPFTYSGDALRLAAKLHLVVDFFEGEVISANKAVKFDVHDIASARRAIVRAAASMSPDLAAGGREGVR